MGLPKEGMAAYIKRRYHERRAKAIEMLGSKCAHCGATESLELDHKDPSQKSFSISKEWSVSAERFWAEASKCQLLCRSCHNIKTITEMGYKVAKGFHGTISSYKYCRCDLCKKAQSDYAKEYRRTHKRDRRKVSLPP